MSDASWLKLLEVVIRELGAEDARIEIGGRDPQDARLIWSPVGTDRRLVASFASPPADRKRKSEQLAQLTAAFHDAAVTPFPPPSVRPVGVDPQGALDAELAGLAVRARASAALVIDASSPMLWGVSHPELATLRGGGGVDDLIGISRTLGTDAPRLEPDELRRRLQPLIDRAPRALAKHLEELDADGLGLLARVARAAVELRTALTQRPAGTGLRLARHEEGFGMLARSLADVYAVALVFDGGFGEPHADGVVRRARDYLEKLIASLPPFEPPPKKQIVRLVD